MVDRNNEIVNKQQKFDNSPFNSEISERRLRKSAQFQTTHSAIDNREDMEMNSSIPKDKHSTNSSISQTPIPTPSSSSISTDSRLSDSIKDDQKTVGINHSSQKVIDSSAGVSSPSSTNVFANDGSFMAMFRKKALEEQMKKEGKGVKRPVDSVESDERQKPSQKPGSSFNLPLVGRRKGPKMLKTGVVAKKVKEEEEEDDKNPDAWSKYLAEVRKYKSQKCIEDDGGSTPLVK